METAAKKASGKKPQTWDILEAEIKTGKTRTLTKRQVQEFTCQCAEESRKDLPSGFGAFQVTKKGIRVLPFTHEFNEKILQLMS
jgi:hypothetical protein